MVKWRPLFILQCQKQRVLGPDQMGKLAGDAFVFVFVTPGGAMRGYRNGAMVATALGDRSVQRCKATQSPAD